MSDAKVELKIKRGEKAIPKGIRLNGIELPNVRNVTVNYSYRAARLVTVEILATDLIEVDEADWGPVEFNVDDIPF